MRYYITETKYNTNCDSRYEDQRTLDADSQDELFYRLEKGVASERNWNLRDGDITPDDLNGDHTAFKVYADEARTQLLYELDFEDSEARIHPTFED